MLNDILNIQMQNNALSSLDQNFQTHITESADMRKDIQFTCDNTIHIICAHICGCYIRCNLQMHMNPLMISAGNVIRRGYV